MSADWEERARCRTVGADPFYPDGRGQQYLAAAEKAKAVCAHCPVQRDCLALALHLEAGADLAGRAGIWGGTTPRERHTIHRQTAA